MAIEFNLYLSSKPEDHEMFVRLSGIYDLRREVRV